jgi:hypothetical protein
MPLARLAEPFDHPDFIFEPKLDGFRALAYLEEGVCRLVSRNRIQDIRTAGPSHCPGLGPGEFLNLKQFDIRRHQITSLGAKFTS